MAMARRCCSGVVYDHFGHDVIFVLRASGLLALDFAQQPVFSLLQVLFAPTPCSLGGSRVKSQVQNLAGQRICHGSHVPHRAVHSDYAGRREAWRCRSRVGERPVPLAAAQEELGGNVAPPTLIGHARVDQCQRQNLFLEQRRDANANAFEFDLALFVTADWNDNVRDVTAFSVSLVLAAKATTPIGRNPSCRLFEREMRK
jgi:hypothetical protein